MLESLSGLLAAIKAAGPRLFFGAAVASGILVFAPSSVLIAMGLTEVVAANRSTIGIVFLVSFVLVCSEGLWWMVRKFQQRTESKALKAGRLRVLKALTALEKAYLAPYILNGENTVHFGIHDGVVGGLQSKEILYQAAAIGSWRSGFAFNIQPWAREALTNNAELLKGAAGSPVTYHPKETW